MTQFPPPPLQPLEQLFVKDGLMITADRWRCAHTYHQQRQNMLYQAINQPGIVTGLGVCAIPAPEEVPAKYRDQRWLEVQPGLAIDISGNPIVVTHPVAFRIASGESVALEPITVYLVISHVDPQNLVHREEPETVQETFRLDEKTDLPSHNEIELCRIQIQPGAVLIQSPEEVLSPRINQIDLRYRLQPQSRAGSMVTVGVLTSAGSEDIRDAGQRISDRHRTNLTALLESLDGLYPSLRGQVVQTVGMGQIEQSDRDLLFASASSISENDIDALKGYLDTGGTLLLEAVAGDSETLEVIQTIAQRLGLFLRSLLELSEQHPLKTKPFLFSELPNAYEQEIQLLVDGGLIVLVGELSASWGASSQLAMPRSEIRTAQEFGINLLHYASRRRSLQQLLNQVPHN
jgi:hypothetical protein